MNQVYQERGVCSQCFFPREPRKSAREQFRKSAREHFACARERLVTNLPVNPKSAREQ